MPEAERDVRDREQPVEAVEEGVEAVADPREREDDEAEQDRQRRDARVLESLPQHVSEPW